jgi:glutathione S-transferase
MRLYDNAFSPFARKVRLVLDTKGLAYEAFDALMPEARARLADANRRVEVPVLEDGDVSVVNSSDIVAYLEHRYPEPPVLPADPALRVKARLWERRADVELDAILHDASIWTWPLLERHDAPPAGLQEAARSDLEEIYDDLEAALDAEGFLCGELSIADLALYPHLSAVAFLRIPFRADRHPRLVAWFARVRALPVCQQDTARLRAWTKSVRETGLRATHIFWRGDRIEWMLAHGLHEWFFEEIRAGRAVWPKR